MKTFCKIILPLCILLFVSIAPVSVFWFSVVNRASTPPRGSVTTGAPLPSNATLIINTTLPEVPKYAYTLKMVPRGWSERQALEMAEKIFNVPDASGKIYHFTDDPLGGEGWTIGPVMMYAKGLIICHEYTDSEWYGMEFLPTDETCIAIAEKFIEKLEAEGLIPTSLSFSLYNVGPSEMRSISWRNGTIEEFVGAVSVHFRYSYEGIPIQLATTLAEGLAVGIGMNGKIKGFGFDLRDVQSLEQVSIGSPEWAMTMFKEGYGVGDGGYWSSNYAAINSIELVYLQKNFLTGMPYDLDILVPAYWIKGAQFQRIIPADLEFY